MTRARRTSPRATIDFDRLLASCAALAQQDAIWLFNGYERTSARLWRCRDGSFTARVVWRDRKAVLSTITCTVQGVTLR